MNIDELLLAISHNNEVIRMVRSYRSARPDDTRCKDPSVYSPETLIGHGVRCWLSVHLHRNDIRLAALVRLLISNTPRSDGEAKMSAGVFDLGVVTHTGRINQTKVSRKEEIAELENGFCVSCK